MKPAPVPPLIVSQPEFLLQFFVVALDAPAQLSGSHEPAKADRFWQVRQPVLCRLLLCFWPLKQQPLFWARLASLVVPMRHAYAQGRKAGSHRAARAFAQLTRRKSPELRHRAS